MDWRGLVAIVRHREKWVTVTHLVKGVKSFYCIQNPSSAISSFVLFINGKICYEIDSKKTTKNHTSFVKLVTLKFSIIFTIGYPSSTTMEAFFDNNRESLYSDWRTRRLWRVFKLDPCPIRTPNQGRNS